MNINFSFHNCILLSKITLPINLIACDMGYVFARCPLRNIIFPATITSIKSHFMIEGCTALEYIKCLSKNPPTIVETTLLRANDTYLIYVPDSSVDAYKAAANWSNFASRIKPMSEFTE